MKEFKGLKLDRFQEEAITHIEDNYSVVVSAATGTGKTLIADYVIDKYLKLGKKIVYTAPIKALSNQKYADFKKSYGEDKVGILTGDVTINHEAPLRVMTTEIYRNMLLSNDPDVEDIAYVVFDEIHFLGDIERGTVWEESLIFSMSHTRFLCLSATIPNAKQLANWISHIKGHEVKLVVEKKRAVPLKQLFYDTQRGLVNIKELHKLKELDKYPRHFSSKKARRQHFEDLKNKKRHVHLDLIKDIKDKLPGIYFCFSRVETQKKAYTISKKNNFLNADEYKKVISIVRSKFSNQDESVHELQTTRTLREALSKGVGFHHAGLLPIHKEIVEELFSQGLIKVLFATETFAVGINMPAKTVIFDSFNKFDGINFRYLNSKEYFQLAGRAGRRGIDKEGNVICVIERSNMDLKAVERIILDDKDPLKSQFQLSFNTILNMIHSHTEEEQKEILKQNFYTYQQVGRKDSDRIFNSFKKKKRILQKNNFFIEGTGGVELTEKGLFSMKVYQEELLLGEIFCHKEASRLLEEEILLIIGRVVFEEKKNTKMKINTKKFSKVIYNKFSNNFMIREYFKKNPMYLVETFLLAWYEGIDFIDLLDLTTMPEGDIVRFIRQILDLSQQIQHATLNNDLKQKLINIQKKLDRDVVSVRF